MPLLFVMNELFQSLHAVSEPTFVWISNMACSQSRQRISHLMPPLSDKNFGGETTQNEDNLIQTHWKMIK